MSGRTVISGMIRINGMNKIIEKRNITHLSDMTILEGADLIYTNDMCLKCKRNGCNQGYEKDRKLIASYEEYNEFNEGYDVYTLKVHELFSTQKLKRK